MSASVAKPEPALYSVPIEHLGTVWPHVAERIAGVVERSAGRWSVPVIAEQLLSGAWQLWIVNEGGNVTAVIATEIYTEATGLKLARVVFCTGQGAEHWVHLVREIEAWARDNGAERIEMMARKGWAKHLADYKMTHVLLERSL